MSADILKLLNDDANYYGAVGKSFLSNSDIGTLLENPKKFGTSRPDDKTLAIGRLFHQLLIEPEKAEEVKFVEASTRTTNLYKEYVASNNLPFALLKSEVDEVKHLANVMKSNIDFYDAIYKSGNQYEVPAIKTIHGREWKGKTDILGEDVLIDLKTTSDINSFKWSAKKYNYDSQAYIYQELFGKPLVFYVIDKATYQLGIFRPSAEFIEGGERKVLRALEVYNRFFAPEATESIEDYYIDEVLL